MNLAIMSKAIAGFGAVAVLGFLKMFGVLPDMQVSEAVNVVIAALVTGAAVYFAPKNRK